ncbi:MAG: 3-hydroxyacyl-CoA dehydrogenase family protein, partial [Proteobacteria bacterium]|nr:3-hydroxyacyl-CoA dehydrogenase family protein [Pseudomonadota bacterium]
PLAALLRFKTSQKVNPLHYPAPFSIINNWEKHGTNNSAYKAEVNSIAQLISEGETCKNLVRIFFLREQLKAFSKHNPVTFAHVHVIGAGAMGGDIAAWCALQGFSVTLQDREPKYLSPAITRAYQLFQKKLKRPRKIQAAMDRLIPDVEGTGIKRADVIIEAIYENLNAKQELFKVIEAQAKPTALLATNTSSLPLEKIGSVLKQPNRLVGIHFFNPVALMPLVEIVHGEKTDPDMLNLASAFVGKIDKLPLPVKSSPGFLVNRILMPYLLEAVVLLQEGIPASVIDKAAVNFGMPMGPIELADTVGLDVCLAVAEFITQQLGGVVPQQLIDKVKQGHLGKKSGEGFYKYKKGKALKEKTKSEVSLKDLAHRLIEKMVTTSNLCLKEAVVSDADLVDAGMIFGAGYPPFRGGPMQFKND